MNEQKRGLNGRGIFLFGMVFAVMGILSRALTRGALGVITQENVEAVAGTPGIMPFATMVLVLEAMAVCAVPIFAWLLVEKAAHTENVKKLFGELLVLALLSEVPYDLVMYGKPFAPDQQNPVWALVLCLGVLQILARFPNRNGKSILAWGLAIALGAVLCYLVRMEYGLPMLLAICVFWPHRENFSITAAILASALCVLLSPYYLAAPIGALALHFYRGEPEENTWVGLLYPAALLVAWGLMFLL